MKGDRFLIVILAIDKALGGLSLTDNHMFLENERQPPGELGDRKQRSVSLNFPPSGILWYVLLEPSALGEY